MSDDLNEMITWDTFTAQAAEDITAGALLKAVDSGSEITQTGNVDGVFQVGLCDGGTDALRCVGVALQDASSGGLIAVGFSGIYRFRVSAAVSEGVRVQHAASTDAFEVKTLADATVNTACIGKALTPADTADEFVLVRLNIS